MKLPLAIGLSLSALLVLPGLGREASARGPVSPDPVLTGRINDLQAAIVEGMRAVEATDRERRIARLSSDINALQAALVQALREGVAKD